jgi:hypothetical protein
VVIGIFPPDRRIDKGIALYQVLARANLPQNSSRRADMLRKDKKTPRCCGVL